MRTRSSSDLIVKSFTIPKRRNRRRSKQIVEPELQPIVETLVATMTDTRTMSELLQAPTKGYGDAIVLLPILVENFKLKVGLLTLVTSSQFHGFERDDPHSHIRAARIWLEKEPPHSIHTWKDLVSKFVNFLFPHSMTTHLKNDVTDFQQRFDETFIEACAILKISSSKVRTSRNKPVLSKASATTSSPTPAYLPEITALIDAVKAMLLQNKTPSPTPLKL
nr:hypothetical protein [Tanacetum cinerariifolium]